ncbi:hypothetical protein [Oceanobacillus polygoni]|nr:hypothetical protein [Oceanobacillus polygoni]
MMTVLYISKAPFSDLIIQKIKEQSELELMGCVSYTTTGFDNESRPDVVLLDTEFIPIPDATAAIQ